MLAAVLPRRQEERDASARAPVGTTGVPGAAAALPFGNRALARAAAEANRALAPRERRPRPIPAAGCPARAADTRATAVLRRAVAARRAAEAPRTLARTIGDGHDLHSPRFAGNEDLEACFDDEARLTREGFGKAGTRKIESGEAVRKVQEALIELGFLAAGQATGTYTQETWDAVKALKTAEHLGSETMGDVGPGTMAFLDRHFTPAPTPTCPPCPEDPRTPGCPPCPAPVVTCPPCPEDPRTPGCPACPPPARVCGPNVSDEMHRAWRSAQTQFAALPFLQKLDNCRMLVQPIISRGGSLVLNQDAFDTWGLFQNSASWTRIPPWHGPCGSPGTTGDHCQSRDPLHEDDSVCSNTVQVGSECWLTGTPNYGLFGVAMRTCHDFVSLLSFIPPPFNFAPDLFGLPNTMVLAGAYKLLKGDNIIGPESWVTATWLRGPDANAPGRGNRPRCGTTCAGPAPPPFSIVWEPHMPRSAAPRGRPYLPAAPECP